MAPVCVYKSIFLRVQFSKETEYRFLVMAQIWKQNIWLAGNHSVQLS